MNILVNQSPPGSGKTFLEIARVAGIKARYAIAAERVDMIEELANKIRAEAQKRGTSVTVVTITASSSLRGSSVRQAVQALPSQYPDGHVVAIFSHAALLMSDFSDFDGWHLICDETPSVLDIQDLWTMMDAAFFETHYTLTPTDSAEWFTVGLTEAGAAMDCAQLASDDSHEHLRTFHRRVLEASLPSNDREVICNLAAWSDMETLNMKWAWGSLFSPSQLAPFASVTFLANRFLHSLSAKLMAKADPSIEWIERSPLRTREFTHRPVTISYFSNRRASKYLFDRVEGQDNLRKIAAYLTRSADTSSLIWSCNDALMEHLSPVMPGRPLRPRQAGSNAYATYTEAAMIYSAKPSPNVSALIRHLKVDRADWVASNEHEAILQFVTRTSVRDDQCGSPVRLYVYEKAQADFLQNYFDTLPHVTATTEYVDLGIYDAEQTRGRKKRIMTPEEAAEWKAKDRASRTASQAKWRAKSKADAA
jgi:hypothetical protein